MFVGLLITAGCCWFRLIGLRWIGVLECLFVGYFIAMLGWFCLIVWVACLIVFDCFFRLRVI